MRHGKKFNHLSRKTAHRSAMLSNMACSLLTHKRIKTTVAKAKALRVYVEPIITKSKDDTTHSRRVVFGYLQDKETVTELFRDIAPKIADRPGGYTRIIKIGSRSGDSAEMCFIELVDYNELMLADKSAKKTTRRSRRGGSKTKVSAEGTTAAAPNTEAKKEETPKAEAKKEEAPKAEAAKEEAPKAEVKTEEAPKEAKTEEKKEEKAAEAPKAEKEEKKAEDKTEDKEDKKEDKA